MVKRSCPRSPNFREEKNTLSQQGLSLRAFVGAVVDFFATRPVSRPRRVFPKITRSGSRSSWLRCVDIPCYSRFFPIVPQGQSALESKNFSQQCNRLFYWHFSSSSRRKKKIRLAVNHVVTQQDSLRIFFGWVSCAVHSPFFSFGLF